MHFKSPHFHSFIAFIDIVVVTVVYSSGVVRRYDRKHDVITCRDGAGSCYVIADVIAGICSLGVGVGGGDDGGRRGHGGEGRAVCRVPAADHRAISASRARQQLARGLFAMFVLRLPSWRSRLDSLHTFQFASVPA